MSGRAESSAFERILRAIAHELRNPLFGVTMNLELLAELGPDDASERETALANARQEVTELTDLAKLLSAFGHASASRREVWLAELLELARRKELPIATARGVTIATTSPEKAPAIALIAERAELALEAMLHHVVARASSGSIVSVVGEISSAEDEVVLRVEGVGDIVADPDAAFEPLAARDRKTSGLALAFVKHIAEQHGGAVRAEKTATGGALEISLRV